MSRDISRALGAWLDAGGEQIGEIAIRRVGTGLELMHYADVAEGGLEIYTTPESARHIANVDVAGEFRPLKTAPNLRRGWSLVLPDFASARRALDFFYPAMLGAYLSHLQGMLAAVSMRETLGRQSGMYAVTKKITDEQAQFLAGEVCRSDTGCLKTILWRISPEIEVRSLPSDKFDPLINQTESTAHAMPLFCHEICNLLVAKAREVVKSDMNKSE